MQERGLTEDDSYHYELAYCDGGTWRHRLLIPMFDPIGRLVAFQGRSLNGDEPRYRTAGPRPLYVPCRDRISATSLVLTEGPFDAFSVARASANVCATLGTQVSKTQIAELLSLIQEKQIVDLAIMFDREAIQEAYALQVKLTPYIATTVVTYLEAKDPGSMSLPLLHTLLGDLHGHDYSAGKDATSRRP